VAKPSLWEKQETCLPAGRKWKDCPVHQHQMPAAGNDVTGVLLRDWLHVNLGAIYRKK